MDELYNLFHSAIRDNADLVIKDDAELSKEELSSIIQEALQCKTCEGYGWVASGWQAGPHQPYFDVCPDCENENRNPHP